MERPVYLDHNATTPLAPGVLETMTRFLATEFGNPSSSHRYGQAPREAIATARSQVAALIGAQPDQIVFTGCGSEANTLASRVPPLAAPGRSLRRPRSIPLSWRHVKPLPRKESASPSCQSTRTALSGPLTWRRR